jgi:hypothetical protein
LAFAASLSGRETILSAWRAAVKPRLRHPAQTLRRGTRRLSADSRRRRQTSVEPVVVVPEVKLDVQDVFQDTYLVRSITPTQLRIWVNSVKRSVEKKEVLGFSVTDDGQRVVINMSLAAAKKKGWVA